MIRSVLTLFFWILASFALAQGDIAQAVQRSIHLEGGLAQWKGLPQYPIQLSNTVPASPVRFKGYFSLAWDSKNLYVLGVFEQDRSTITAKNPANAAQWWSDDAMEVYLRPDLGSPLVTHYAVNPKGTRFQVATSGDKFKVKSHLEAKQWVLQWAIPLAQTPKEGTVWGLKVGREHQQAKEYSLWPKGGDFSSSNNFGYLVFSQKTLDAKALEAKIARAEPPKGEPLPSRLSDIGSYAVYYGHNKNYNDLLVNYDLAIVQPNTLSAAEIQTLHQQGVKLVAYITIGEIDGTTTGLPKNWVLGTNPNWGSKYANANAADFRETIYRQAQDILSFGFDGFFLDTLDTVDLFPDTAKGMVTIVQELRQRFPEAIIVQNRGFAVLANTAKFVDALMFEDFSTTYDFNSQKYTAYDGDASLVSAYKARGLVILAMEYALPTQKELIVRAYQRAKQHGFIPFISVIALDQIYVAQP